VALVSKADNDLPPPEPSPPPPPLSASSSADPLAVGTYAPPYPIFGDALALVSAFAYAAYVLLLKFRIGDESRIDIMLFFGFVGIFNTVFLWPFLLVLHFTGVETLEWPHGFQLIASILINSKDTVLFRLNSRRHVGLLFFFFTQWQ
jgi:solute carrier family 35 protein F5